MSARCLTVGRFAVALLALTSAGVSPALARDPVARAVSSKGADEVKKLDWDMSWLELSGVENVAVQRRVNLALRREADQAKRTMLDEVDASESELRSFIDMSMSVGLLTSKLLSVTVSSSSYWAGAAHPNNHVFTLTFDLRTGAKVPTRGLFKPGAGVMPRVAALVDAKLRAGWNVAEDGEYFLQTVTARKLGSVLVEKDGLRFIFGAQEIGPHAAGIPEAKLTYAELNGLVATDGVVATVTAPTSGGLAGAIRR
jgi:hypothetical protein